MQNQNTPAKCRTDIIDALNKSIEIFTSHDEKTFEQVMSNGIRPFADAMDLDRVVFYRRMDIDGNIRFGQTSRWDKKGGGLVSLDDNLKALPETPVMTRWISIVSKGGCLRLRESDMTKDEKTFLRVFGVRSIMIVPIFTHGEFWGGVSFQDHHNDKYFDDNCGDLLYSAARLFANAIIMAEMKQNAAAAIEALKRREKLADTLNKAAVIFLSQTKKTFEETMTSGVRLLVDAVDVDRFSIWRNSMKSDGLHGSQIYRWDRDSGGTTPPTPGLEDITYEKFAPRWVEILSNNKTINSPTHLLPEAPMLNSFGVISAFVTPIILNNAFWGFVLLEDRVRERYFDEDSSQMMCSAAFLCVNTVIRAEMEKDLSDINEFNRTLINAAPIGMTIHDEDLNVVDCNDAILKIYETTKQYYIDNFLEFSPDVQPSGEKLEDKVKDVKKRSCNGEKIAFEWFHRTLSGELIPFEITLMPAKYKDQNIILSYQYDLRNIKKMSQSLQEQSKLLKERLEQQELISEISRGFISSGDSETYVKEAIAKMGRYHDVSLVIIFGIDFENQKAYPAYFWTSDGQPPKIVEFDLLSLIKNNFPQSLPDCSTMPIISCEDIEASSVQIFKPLLTVDVAAFICAPLYVEGRLWGILSVEQYTTPRQWSKNEKDFVAMTASTIAGVIMRDIYTNMLKKALHKATTASRAKGEFLSNMSHEMRTPLNAIIGMTTIGKNASDIERKDYALEKIDNASVHLLGVINDILDMSKIEANMLELSNVEFNFEKMLQQVVNVVSFRIEERNQKFSIQVDKQIPQTLIGDDQRLAQIITNLLGNAVKFTPEKGSISLDARFIKEEMGFCTIQVSVKDSGIGISAEQQERVFSSFEQAESSTTRKYGGTGLGLAISKSIVEMMGGRIWIESELNKGASFIFTIQVRRGDDKSLNTGDEGSGGDKMSEEITGMFSGRRILLAEDVEINREIVQTLFEPTQIEIDCAENGLEAVKMFSDAPDLYDLILMDVQMPEMDGHEATRKIRMLDCPNAKTIPIIAMTANVFREDIERCIEAGMNNHLGKPLDFDEVIEKLRIYLPHK